VIYGGTDTVQVLTDSSVDAAQMYFVLDQNSPVVPVNALMALEKRTGKRYFGRTFFVQNSLKSMPPGQGFAMILDRKDFPYTGDPVLAAPKKGKLYGDLTVANAYQPSTYYLTVRAVDKTRAKAIKSSLVDGKGTVGNPATYDYPLYWEIPDLFIKQAATTDDNYVLDDGRTDSGSFGPLSLPASVNFPTDSRVAEIVQTALVIAVLSRSDLLVGAQKDGQAKVATGLEDLAKGVLNGLGFDRAFFTKYATDPSGFARVLLSKTGQLTGNLLQSPIMSDNPDTILIYESLLTFRWSDYDTALPRLTILESLQNTANSESLSLWATGTDRGMWEKREPHFWSWRTYVSPVTRTLPYPLSGAVLTDNSPRVQSTDNPDNTSFCRNALVSTYKSAASVLALSTPGSALGVVQGGGQNWVAIRLLPNGIPQLDRLLSNLDAFFQALLDGFENVGNAIIGYIEFIESKIRNIQALIDQIQGILDFINSLSLPTVSALAVTGAGISGLVQEFASADNKPSDDANAYGFGFAAVGVGLPVVLMELLVAVFGTATDSGGA